MVFCRQQAWPDREIPGRYRLFPPSVLALQLLQGRGESEYDQIWGRHGDRLESLVGDADRRSFAERLAVCPGEHQLKFLQMYANPILNQYRHGLLPAAGLA